MSLQANFNLARGDFQLAIEMSVPSEGVTAIFGPSGCGKTSLLRCIAGLEPRAQGILQFNDITWQDQTQCVPVHQRGIGFVFQDAGLFAHLNVRDNLQFGYKRTPPEQRLIDMDQAVVLLGVEKLLDRCVQGLSGGERQRVAIARVLLTSPQLLLMDEPLAGLDREGKKSILRYLQHLWRELAIPVLYVSHDHSEVAQLAQHMVIMDQGRVQTSGTVSELLGRLDLPLAHAADAETIVDAVIADHDQQYNLSTLEFCGGKLTVAQTELPVGQPVRVRLQARDISLTLSHQTETSILNIFPVTIEEIVPDNPAQLLVRLNANGATILSRITRKSAEHLDLQVGKKVYAQVKSVALPE